MKRLFTKYGVTVLSIAVLVAVLLSAMAYFSNTSAALPNLMGMIAAPFRAAGAAISEKVEGWGDYLTEFDALKAENEELKRQIAEMEDSIRQAELDREENALLRQLNDLREQRRDLHLESARIVKGDTSNWASMFTINKGTAHDIAAGDCVIDQNGALVGVITEAGCNWSTVRTILDSDTSVGAVLFRSKQPALAQGDFSLMSRDRLALTFLGTDPDIVVGDLVVTSGLGDYLPSSLVIGSVESITSEDDGLSRRAVIAPRAEIDDLQQVFIVTDFTIVQ